MNFEFATAARIVFGAGSLSQLPTLAAALGARVLLVTGSDPARHTRRISDWAAGAAGRVVVTREPTVGDAVAGAETARQMAADVVVAIGGGSVLDAAKSIAALARNPGDPLDHLEVIGRGQPLRAEPLPVIAVPTTAGTGTEVTRNAVLAAPDHRVKVSLRSPGLLPRVALVDPELTLTLPPALTATSGLDALTQLLEPFVCLRANPMTDAFCRQGLSRIGSALPRAWEEGGDLLARTDLSLASLLSGLALANAGLGAIHGFAGPLGGMYPAPHGALCAALAAPVTAANLRALRERMPDSPALARYDEAARLLLGVPTARADDLVAWLTGLTARFGIPGLSAHGISAVDFPSIVEKAARASSMKPNPVVLTAVELTRILMEAVGNPGSNPVG